MGAVGVRARLQIPGVPLRLGFDAFDSNQKVLLESEMFMAVFSHIV